MKDKTVAAIFALFLGWFGIHRFYLKQPGLGVLYIFLFFAFGISFVLGIIDAIVLLAMDPQEFDRRYNDEDRQGEHDRYRRRRQTRDYRRTDRTQRSSHNRTSRERHSRDRRKASAHRTSGRKPSRRQKINPYKQSGIKKHKEFDLEGAIEDFKKGLEISPEDIALHFNIACSYSLTEQPEKAFDHLDKAVAFGFKDTKRIETHDDLAFVRIQPQYEEFKENGFRLNKAPRIEAPKQNPLDDDILLSQLNRLTELKEKGVITEKEFLAEKQKLMR